MSIAERLYGDNPIVDASDEARARRAFEVFKHPDGHLMLVGPGHPSNPSKWPTALSQAPPRQDETLGNYKC